MSRCVIAAVMICSQHDIRHPLPGGGHLEIRPHLLSSDSDQGLFRFFLPGFLVEASLHLRHVEVAYPLADHDGGDAIPHQIREGSRLGHETVDPQYRCESRDGEAADRAHQL